MAVAEAHHIHACAQAEALVVAVVDALVAQDAAGHVHHLQGGLAAVVDHELAVADEGEVVGDVVGGFFGKHELEARGVGAVVGVEAVLGRAKQDCHWWPQ